MDAVPLIVKTVVVQVKMPPITQGMTISIARLRGYFPTENRKILKRMQLSYKRGMTAEIMNARMLAGCVGPFRMQLA